MKKCLFVTFFSLFVLFLVQIPKVYALGADGSASGGTNSTSVSSTPQTTTKTENCTTCSLPYTPLEPVPYTSGQSGNVNFSAFLLALIKILISLGGLLAVGALVLGGTTYMVSEVVGKKVQAKQRVAAALLGLLLLLSTWLILKTINPQLLNLKVLNPQPTNNVGGTTNAAGINNAVTENPAATPAQVRALNCPSGTVAMVLSSGPSCQPL